MLWFLFYLAHLPHVPNITESPTAAIQRSRDTQIIPVTWTKLIAIADVCIAFPRDAGTSVSLYIVPVLVRAQPFESSVCINPPPLD